MCQRSLHRIGVLLFYGAGGKEARFQEDAAEVEEEKREEGRKEDQAERSYSARQGVTRRGSKHAQDCHTPTTTPP